MPNGAMGTMKMSPYTIMSGTLDTRVSFGLPEPFEGALLGAEGAFAMGRLLSAGRKQHAHRAHPPAPSAGRPSHSLASPARPPRRNHAPSTTRGAVVDGARGRQAP